MTRRYILADAPSGIRCAECRAVLVDYMRAGESVDLAAAPCDCVVPAAPGAAPVPMSAALEVACAYCGARLRPGSTECCKGASQWPSDRRAEAVNASTWGRIERGRGKRERAGESMSYRLRLHRRIGASAGVRTGRVLFCMLNPSTAECACPQCSEFSLGVVEVDDPTIRRCMGFADAWKCGRLSVVNLYALRSTDPRQLWAARDPVGGGNDCAIADEASRADLIVAAWGEHGRRNGRGFAVFRILQEFGEVCALGFTASGQPKHPLYLPADSQLVRVVNL